MSLLGKWFGFGRGELYDEALRLFERGDFEGAVERFETVLERTHDPAVARMAKLHVAQSYARIGARYAKAGDPYQAAIN